MQNNAPDTFLDALEDELGIATPEAGKDGLPDPLSLDELEALDIPGTQWVMAKLIPYPGLIAVSGRPGSFKTFFCLWLAVRIAQGLPLFDEKEAEDLAPLAGPVPVLFIEEENTVRLVRERVLGMRKGSVSNLYFYVDQGFKMRDPRWREKVLGFVAAKGIRVVFMDPFSSVMGLKDENDNSEVSEVMDIIRKEFLKNDVAVVFIHHPSKGDEGGKTLRGAGDIIGKCDVHVTLENEQEDRKTVRVSYEKMRVADESLMRNFKMRIEGDPALRDTHFSWVGEAKPKWQEERDGLLVDARAALPTMPDEFGRKDLAEACGSSEKGDRFVAVWTELLRTGEVVKVTAKKFRRKTAMPVARAQDRKDY